VDMVWKGGKMIKLDMGCGLNTKKPLDEWIHLDCDKGPHIEIVCDFVDIPLEDDYVDEIWVGDVIEHVPVWKYHLVFPEWKRILKPHGLLHGTTPSLDSNIKKYVAGEINRETLMRNLYGDQAGYPHQHYNLFTKTTLTDLLANYGFKSINLDKSPGDKANPWWLVFSCKNGG